MFGTKRAYKLFVSALLIFIAAFTVSVGSAYAAPSEYLYLGGFPAGFILNTQNVEVIGTCDIFTEDGAKCPAREQGVRSGDIIKQVNGKKISSAAMLTELLDEQISTYNLTILRKGETVNVQLQPEIDKATGKRRLGILVKDSINGIGTVTYVDGDNLKYGSLGHPVSDMNGELIEINGGSLYGCTVYDVKKGLRGNPGEIKGIFDNSCIIGSVNYNCACGIFGNISSEFNFQKLKKVKKGCVEDAKIGRALIYSTLNGEECRPYDISIVKVDASNKDKRNFVIKINDSKLLEKSGGIVQGMSGSPIVQNGKLIGAVTHVFVNDPTRGYGIAIEHMTNSY